MGGRGGAPSVTTNSPTRSLAINPSQEYREWFNSPRDITADSMGAFGGHDRINILLPDRDASLEWDGRSFVVRDTQTDQLLPFKGQRQTTVYRQISRFYGRKVEVTYKGRAPLVVGGDTADLSKTPAARKYGMGR